MGKIEWIKLFLLLNNHIQANYIDTAGGRRMTVANNYHSSDNTRNIDMKINIMKMKNHGSQNRLPIQKLTIKNEERIHVKGIKNIKNPQSLKHTDHETKNRGIQNYFMGKSPQKKEKLKEYKFLRNNKAKIINNKNKSREINESENNQSPKNSPKILEKYKITEENNRLIDQMINRKRLKS